jgi:hypothetical protein
MRTELPGFNPQRLMRLVEEAVHRCALDLQGAVVLTEAASGAYVVTPVLAAMAGADHVFALTRSTRYGTVAEICAQTEHLAELAGVRGRVSVVTEKTGELVARADIVTNSGHVRPIDSTTAGWMKPTAVIPLMYEAWELRPADIDLDACHRRGIRLAGTNERHPAVDVFSYLGVMAVKLLLDAGVAVYGSRILVLCDNPFAPYIERGLAGAGAHVHLHSTLPGALAAGGVFDAVLVALQPGVDPVIDMNGAALLAERWPGAVIAQYWGDVDRAALADAGAPVWPEQAPSLGHMGILPSGVGPEPIVRLQAGGLKVGEVLLRGEPVRQPGEPSWIDEYV